MSGGSQLSGEEPKRISFLDDRGRSSEIKNDDRNNSSIHTRLSIIFIASTGFVINDLSCTLESAFERDILEAYTKLREFQYRTNLPAFDLKTKPGNFYFRWTNHLPSRQRLRHTPDCTQSSITRSPT
ncbi:hypothetical protein ALC60_09814 [Trachymyrmex zeteki]|uniref:Uncharacterized protein n=1 Tax=Mycetomoellerius zeteki TaxID=64791 RepID=A0A151WT52_9HYME|nr:hypothetical protein ALC60_09814 [Trachymyrmex zeteki]